MLKKLFFIFILFYSISFAQKKIIIFETVNTNSYAFYAVNDLVTKNIFLYSDFDVVPSTFIEENNYAAIKSKIKELTINNKADISVTYNLIKHKNGIILNYVIFDTSKQNKWFEKNIYSKEEKLFNSINQMIEDIYSYSSINNKHVYIEEDEYISLIGYYSQRIVNSKYDKNLYSMFFNFYKDNIYFNMDYLEYLMINDDKTMINDIGIMVTNMTKVLDKNNHYYLSALGDWYYSKYKVNVILNDIELSVENYLKAIEAKKNNYIYYEKLADAYVLKNDYNNASKYYKIAIKICDKDSELIKDAVYLLKNDMNNNGNIVIEYLKRIIEINKNDDEAIEELAKIYETLGDSYNAEIYYTKLLDVVNYQLYIINNERPNPVLYDKYIKKRNEVAKKTCCF